MKNSTGKFKWTGLFILLFILMAFLPVISKAQQCSNIVNNLSCDIDITVRVYTNVGGVCVYCNSYGVNIPAGGNAFVGCPCSPICNEELVISAIGGTAVSSSSIVSFTSGAGTVAGGAPGCLPNSTGTINYFSVPNSFIINP